MKTVPKVLLAGALVTAVGTAISAELPGKWWQWLGVTVVLVIAAAVADMEEDES